MNAYSGDLPGAQSAIMMRLPRLPWSDLLRRWRLARG
jgi:hypothetical protein